jgi:uncharacterized integral membrane protein
MRWFHLSVIIVLAVAVLLFAAQNLQLVTLSFLGLSATVPLALMALIIYVLGMATGGSLRGLVRWLMQGSRSRPTTPP